MMVELLESYWVAMKPQPLTDSELDRLIAILMR